VSRSKRRLARKKAQAEQEMVDREYRFDYSKSISNRLAARMSGGAIAVALEPDVKPCHNPDVEERTDLGRLCIRVVH
jgi:hypothetical protein